MGVTISKSILSPLSVASVAIGFISFAFTLGTFFKVVWVNLTTLSEAPHEIHAYLTNLRTELLEERANLRGMKKAMRRSRRIARKYDMGMGTDLDEIIWKTMDDSLRNCIKRFRAMEKPFLAEGEQGIGEAGGHARRRRRRNSSGSPPRYSHGAYSSPPEKADREHYRSAGGRGNEHSGETETHWDNREDDEDAFWAQRTRYKKFTVNLRFRWLIRKSEAQQLMNDLTRLQLRRVARQVAGITVMIHEFGCGTMDLKEAVTRIDERVSRVIGVRRIPDDDR